MSSNNTPAEEDAEKAVVKAAKRFVNNKTDFNQLQKAVEHLENVESMRSKEMDPFAIVDNNVKEKSKLKIIK